MSLNNAPCVRVPIEGGNKIKYSLPLFFSEYFFPAVADKIAIQIYYGGAGSGKSVTIARKTILEMMYGNRNFLVVRKVYGTLKDSFYTELLKAISDLCLSKYFKATKNPLEIQHIASGNVILFRGLDDKEKIKSITAPNGVITDLIIEEATEITEEDFNMLDTRLRGLSSVPKRITILFNPIYKSHWIYKRFFDGRFSNNDKDLVYSIPVVYTLFDDNGNPYQVEDEKKIHIHKSTHKDNKFLLPEDHARYEHFKNINKYYYDVYCCGNWGVLGDLIFDQDDWYVADLSEVSKAIRKKFYGLDYGWNPDPFACVSVGISYSERKVYVFSEVGGKEASAQSIANMIYPMVGSNKVICDSSENRTTDQLVELGLNAHKVYKRRGNVNDSNLYCIQWLKFFTIVIDKSCREIISEIEEYAWEKDKDGNSIAKAEDGNDHFIQAVFYALNDEMGRIKPDQIF